MAINVRTTMQTTTHPRLSCDLRSSSTSSYIIPRQQDYELNSLRNAKLRQNINMCASLQLHCGFGFRFR